VSDVGARSPPVVVSTGPALNASPPVLLIRTRIGSLARLLQARYWMALDFDLARAIY